MGKATKRTDKRFVTTLTFQGKRYYCYGATRAEAQVKRTEKLAELQNPQPGTTQESVSVYLTTWLVNAKPSWKPSTAETHTWAVEKHLKPVLGKHKLAALTPTDVQSAITHWQTGHKPNTVRNIVATLRAALNDAVTQQQLAVSPLGKPRLPKAQRYTPRILSSESVSAFLKAIQGHTYELIFRTALFAGLRRGEVLALRWCDVDCDHTTLHIRGTLVYVGKQLVYLTPKNDKDTDSVPMVPDLVTRYNAYPKTGTTYIFETKNHTPLGPRNVLREYRKVLVKAGIDPKTRLHDLRHSCATLLVADGVDAKTVQTILRHSDVRTTLMYYIHTDTGRTSAALTRLAERFT